MGKKKKHICECGAEFSPNPKYNDYRVKCDKCIKKTKSSEVKARAVDYLGGMCLDCEFKGHPIAYDFDHKDPNQKEFKISGKYILLWRYLRKELDKCELRCCRCHRIKHYKEQYPEQFK